MYYNILDREDLTGEIWKVFPENDYYSVSNLGRVKNNKTGRILKQTLTKGVGQGYCKIELKRDGQKQYWRIHRMVMITFAPIENYKEFQVDHINGIRNDNRLENLRWNSALLNAANKNSNRTVISDILNKKIMQYGYEKVIRYLQEM